MKNFLLSAILAVTLVSCMTTKQAPSSSTEVTMGDTLQIINPKFADCSMKVGNIASLKDSPFGVIKISEVVFCGDISCTVQTQYKGIRCLGESEFFDMEKKEVK